MSHIAVVGATGLVGSCFLNLLEETNISFSKLSLFASPKNQGKTLKFKEKQIPIQTLKPGCFKGCDIAFFSAGGKVSLEWAERAGQEGCTVIDNSSAFRMKTDIPLIVPEINAGILNSTHKLIANPNCSTIQLCLALHPLHQAFGLQSVQTATYQSLSGAGAEAVQQLKTETQNSLDTHTPGQYAFNCIPQIGKINDNGFSEEDLKMQNESGKILNIPALSMTVFTVRVPTLNSHGEAVWVHLKKPPKNRQELVQAMKKQEGLEVMEDVRSYPDNRTASQKNPVYVGRIHQDPQNPSTWLMWICADNLRKGAALNGLQIAQFLLKS